MTRRSFMARVSGALAAAGLVKAAKADIPQLGDVHPASDEWTTAGVINHDTGEVCYYTRTVEFHPDGSTAKVGPLTRIYPVACPD
jgi:hypothetical protein